MTKYRPVHEQGMGRMIVALCGGDLVQFLPLFGRKLLSVDVESDKSFLVFRFTDGEVKYLAAGDCCSYTWIEHLETPADLNGAEVVSVSEHPVIDATDDDSKNPKQPSEWNPNYREHDCLQLYQTIFNTTKGDISVEYRNSSNGYYGGYLELVKLPCTKCGEEFNRYNGYEHASKCYADLSNSIEVETGGG